MPGLVAALAVDMGDQLNFLPSTTIAALGGWQVVWDQAVANLRQLPPMAAAKTHATEGRADTAVYELRSADPFGASRLCDLKGLVAAAGVQPGSHGLLVAVPSWLLGEVLYGAHGLLREFG